VQNGPVPHQPHRRAGRGRSRTTQLALAAVALAAAGGGALTSCNDDGRTLRPARPDQVGSVSSLAAPTTQDPALVDGGLDGAIDEGASEFDTLPLEQTLAPTSAPVGETVDPGAGGAVDPSLDGVPGSADVPLVSGDPVDGSPIGSSDLPAGPGDDIGGDETVLIGPWAQGEAIDPNYTCDGDDNVSPPLTWSIPPEGTVEIAVSMIDQDADGFIHWVMAGIDPSVTSLEEAEVPEGAIVGRNSIGAAGYYGPCPPEGSGTHRYVFTVHYLMQATELTTGAPAEDLLAVVDGATFGGASLVGTFARG